MTAKQIHTDTRVVSIKRNTLWNLLGAGLPLIVGALTVPYLIKAIGIERFGVLTMFWAIVGYFGLFDFGLGRAVTQRIAQALAENRTDKIPALAGTGIMLAGFAGLIGAVLLGAFAWTLAHSTLNVSPALHAETFHALLLCAVAIPLTTMATGFRGVLEAYEDFKASNIAKIFLGTSIFLFPAVGVIFFGPSLTNIAAWLLFSRASALLAFYVPCSRLPIEKIKLFQWDSESIHALVKFSAWMAVSNLISPLLVYADRFIISHALGAAVVAYYTVPFEFIVRLLIIPGAIGATLLPRLSIAYCKQTLEANQLVRKTFRLIAVAMSAFSLGGALMAYPLMYYFISPEFAEKSWPIAVILCAGVLFNSLAFVPYTALHARGIAKPTAIFHTLEFIGYIPILLLSISTAGLLGAAVAWAGRTFIDLMLLLVWYRKLEAAVPIESSERQEHFT